MKNVFLWLSATILMLCISSCGNKGDSTKETTETIEEEANYTVEEEEIQEMEPVENEVLNYIAENLWVEIDDENYEPISGNETHLVTKDEEGFYYYDGNVMCDFSPSGNADKGVNFATECGMGVPFTCIDFAFIDEDIIMITYYEQCARLDEDAGAYYYMKSGSEPVSYTKKPKETDSLFLCRYFNNEIQKVNFVHSITKGEDILFTLEDDMVRKMEYIYNARKIDDEFIIDKLELPEEFKKLAFSEAYSFKIIKHVDGPVCKGIPCYLIIIAQYHTMEGAPEGDGFILIDDYYGFAYTYGGMGGEKDLVNIDVVVNKDFDEAWQQTIVEVRDIME